MAARRGKRSAATALLSSTPSPPQPSALSSSTAAAAVTFPLTENGIPLLKSRRHTGQIAVTATVRVLSVHRFLVDAQYVNITNIAAPVAPDPEPPLPSQLSQAGQAPAALPLPPLPPSDSGYDVVLGDGRHKTKCLLAPSFSPLVEQGGLLPGSVVTVYDCVRRFDETVVGGHGFVVIRGMTVRDRGRTATLDGGGVGVDWTEQWASAEASKEREHRPLLSSRSFYLNLWHDDSLDLPAPQPPPAAAAAPFDLDDPNLHLITIVGALAGDYKGNEMLLCRVSGKSRLIRFGKAYTNGAAAGGGNPAPFMFEMLLIDATGCLKAAVWNSLASQMYSLLHVGQVLTISQFRHRHHADTDEVELSLNPSHPAATILIVPPASYATLSPPVPVVPYSMVRLWEMRSLPDKKHADVMCEVGWAGRMEREWSRQYRQYFCYRWLLLQDDTAEQSLAVKLYCNSQDEQVAGVKRGEAVLVTSLQLTTTREMIDSRQRSVYAQTTQFSQLTREVDLLNSDDARLSDQLQHLQKWQSARPAIASPLPSMWQWDVSYVSWESKHSADGRVVVTPVSELRQLKDELRFMQHKTLLVQGVITDVQLMPAGLHIATDHGLEAMAQAIAEQPAAKSTRGTRPRKRQHAPPLGAASVIPISNASLPLLHFQLSDLNYEHHVRVQLTNRPVPYATVGGEGSALHVYRAIADADADAAIARLPAVVRGLLELLPATAINGEEVEQAVSAFSLPAAPAREPRQSKSARARSKSGRSKSQPPPPPPSRANLSQPTPTTARVTRSMRKGKPHSYSQETAPKKPSARATQRQQLQPHNTDGQVADRQQAQQQQREEKAEAVELSAEESQRLVGEVVTGLLLNKQALAALSVYRSSYETVEVSVTNLFSLLQQADVH